MSFTYTVTVVPQTFEHRGSEAAYICSVLNLAIAALQSTQGDQSSGNLIGQTPAGVSNSILGAFTFTTGALLP
jgi:hypothetical protein